LLKSEIKKAQDRYKHYSDRNRIESPKLEEGDKVYLSARNIKTTRPTRKFSERRLGPFTILKKISDVAFKLKLPREFNQLHPVFHISLLEKTYDSQQTNRHNDPPPPVEIEGELEYEVEEILDMRKRRNQIQYLVKWKGYEGTEEERTWEPVKNLENAKDLIEKYHQKKN
jgi:hypothetical protein